MQNGRSKVSIAFKQWSQMAAFILGIFTAAKTQRRKKEIHHPLKPKRFCSARFHSCKKLRRLSRDKIKLSQTPEQLSKCEIDHVNREYYR